jgi:hypothetical protein
MRFLALHHTLYNELDIQIADAEQSQSIFFPASFIGAYIIESKRPVGYLMHTAASATLWCISSYLLSLRHLDPIDYLLLKWLHLIRLFE